MNPKGTDAHTALRAHMDYHRGRIITAASTAASTGFDRLYNLWIQARWDAGDAWVRSIWIARPEAKP